MADKIISSTMTFSETSLSNIRLANAHIPCSATSRTEELASETRVGNASLAAMATSRFSLIESKIAAIQREDSTRIFSESTCKSFMADKRVLRARALSRKSFLVWKIAARAEAEFA